MINVDSFFDELTKISADLGFEKNALTEGFFKSPMAKTMISTWNAAKGAVPKGQGAISTGTARVNQAVRGMSAARGGPSPLMQAAKGESPVMAQLKARKAAEAQRAAQQAAARARSMQGSPLGAGQFQTPASMSGRAQILAAQQAERDARSGALQRRPKMIVQ